ncbi:hypothetical protein JCM10212_004924 [Sporobolomyces blumeae]
MCRLAPVRTNSRRSSVDLSPRLRTTALPPLTSLSPSLPSLTPLSPPSSNPTSLPSLPPPPPPTTTTNAPPPPYTAPLAPPIRSRSSPHLNHLAFTHRSPSIDHVPLPSPSPSTVHASQPRWSPSATTTTTPSLPEPPPPPRSYSHVDLASQPSHHHGGPRPVSTRRRTSSSTSLGLSFAARGRPPSFEEASALGLVTAARGPGGGGVVGIGHEYGSDDGDDHDEALEIRASGRSARRRQGSENSALWQRRGVTHSGVAPSAATGEVERRTGPRSRTGTGDAAASSASTVVTAQPTSTSPSRSRIWTPLLFSLNFLSVIPSLIGFLYSAHRFYTTPPGLFSASPSSLVTPSSGIVYSRSTRLDWFVSGMWSLACAYFTHSLARGLLKRWLVYYSLGPTIVRVVSLQAICWPMTLTTHRVLSFDQPVAAWFVCATTAAISNVIQSWVTSNIVERKDRRGETMIQQPRWTPFVSSAITAVLGPGVRTDKYRKGERVLSWKRVLWGTVLPFAVLGWATTNALLWQQFVARYRGGGGIDLGRPSLDYELETVASSPFATLPELDPLADVRVLVLVTSSWDVDSVEQRQAFRESSLKLVPRRSHAVSIAHRFVLGTAPSPHVASRVGPTIEAESAEHRDVVVVPAHDAPAHRTRKAYEAFKWASEVVRSGQVDYVVRTDEDTFVRLDVVAKELRDAGRTTEYWKGFAYWDMPPSLEPVSTAFGTALPAPSLEFGSVPPVVPPYTSPALEILSSDLVSLVAPRNATRRLFLPDEGQSLGVWLYPFGVRPMHDRRIQEGSVCENDLVARRFSRSPLDRLGRRNDVRNAMMDMFENVQAGRKLCDGFEQNVCGTCYPSCRRRKDHWSDRGFACDDVMGATMTRRPSLFGSRARLDDAQPVRVAPEVRAIGTRDNPWIVPGLLSRYASVLSDTDDWSLLHVTCWTRPRAAFLARHLSALETVWVHEPRTVVVVLSPTLEQDDFEPYRAMGYAVHVVRVGQAELLEREWFVGKASETWVRNWDKWARGPHFETHLVNYLRYLFLFRYGGNYLDLDSATLRSPPSSQLEYVGTAHSLSRADDMWALDDEGTYLSLHSMRFKRGWTILADALERAFSTALYDPLCADCTGSRTLTTIVKASRRRLERNGLSVLPGPVTSPATFYDAHKLVRALVSPLRRPSGSPSAARAELARLEQGSWQVSFFDRMTEHLPIDGASVLAEVFETFSLRRIGATGGLGSNEDAVEAGQGATGGVGEKEPRARFELRYPAAYRYRDRLDVELDDDESGGGANVNFAGSLDGTFEGLDKIYVRSLVGTGILGSTVVVRVSTPAARTEGDKGSSGAVALSPAHGLRHGTGPNGEGGLGGASSLEWRLDRGRATLQAVNAILSSLRYVPPSIRHKGTEPRARDEVRIEVEAGEEKLEGTIDVVL